MVGERPWNVCSSEQQTNETTSKFSFSHECLDKILSAIAREYPAQIVIEIG